MSIKKEDEKKLEKVIEAETLIYEKFQALANLEYCLRLDNASNINAVLIEEYRKLYELLQEEDLLFDSLKSSSTSFREYRNYLISKYNINIVLNDCDTVLYAESLPAVRVVKKLEKYNAFTRNHFMDIDYSYDASKKDIEEISEKFYYAEDVLGINQVVMANLMKQMLEEEYRDTYFIQNIDSILKGEHLEELVAFKYNYMYAYDCFSNYLNKYIKKDSVDDNLKASAKARKDKGLRLAEYAEFASNIILDQISDSLEELLKYDARGSLKQLHLYQLKSKKEFLEDEFKVYTEIPMDEALRTETNRSAFDDIYKIFYGEPVKDKKSNKKSDNRKKPKVKIKVTRQKKN